MRTTILLATLLSLAPLSLAACSGGGDDAGNNSGGASSAVEPTPNNLMDDPTNTVVPLDPPGNRAAVSPVPLPTGSPTPLATIPAAYRGRWGMVVGDCDPAKDFAAKGLVTVSADRLAFYESRATPRAIRDVGGGRLDLDLAFSGEGQTWQHHGALTLLGDGRTLVVEQQGGDVPSARYSRCPA